MAYPQWLLLVAPLTVITGWLHRQPPLRPVFPERAAGANARAISATLATST